MFEVFLFILGTACLVFLSRASLKVPTSHGFFRFFAWECILILFLLNARYWFVHPFSPFQIVSWLLLIISGILAGSGFILLRHKGNPSEQREDLRLIGTEKTTTLVTEGIFRYIRHPLYSSLLFLAWGIFFKLPSWLGALLGVTTSVLLFLTAKTEERENIQYFSKAYQIYMEHTQMFIPFVF
jgi:protein-S-isoprenylcysteine O-methyltransferase Ste14